MNQADLEPRLHDALHSGSLPPAPAEPDGRVERVPDAPVRLRRRRVQARSLGLFAAAAVLLVASAVGPHRWLGPDAWPDCRTSQLSSTQVRQVWNTDSATALTIHRDPTDTGIYYWRARTST